MNLLDIGDPLIAIFAYMNQMDVYTFAQCNKKAKLIVIAYAKRHDICKYLRDKSMQWNRRCIDHGHILCALVHKKVTDADGIYALFNITPYRSQQRLKRKHETSGAIRIIILFQRQFDDYVDNFLERIVMCVLRINVDMTFWNLIEFNQQRLIHLASVFARIRAWDYYLKELIIFMGKWTLDNKKKSIFWYDLAIGKHKKDIIAVPRFCSIGAHMPSHFGSDIWWYVCDNCGKIIAEH